MDPHQIRTLMEWFQQAGFLRLESAYREADKCRINLAVAFRNV